MSVSRPVSLENLINFAAVRQQNQFGITEHLYADTTGFHVYCRLGLTLRLSAAEDDRSANRHLRILEAYTSIVDAAAQRWGARILEVQGEVIHLLIPAANADTGSVGRVIAFSSAVTVAVYSHVAKLARDAFDGFKTAADHGRCIIVGLADEATSVISLGPAANAPAKILPGVSAGHLCLRREHWLVFSNDSERTNWVEVDVLNPKELVRKAVESEPASAGLAQFAANTRWTDVRPDDVPIQFRPQGFAFSATSAPSRVQGLFFRADLDGFSAQVLAAFATGSEQEIKNLVDRFCSLVGFSSKFRQDLRWPSISLPWAGDCANMILMPRAGQEYATIREATPVLSAKSWHEQFGEVRGPEGRWSDLSGGARWAVGIAGGDDNEGNAGVVLLANLRAAGRLFAVAAGWSVRRSSDAYQAEGVRAGDTVIPRVDRRALETPYQAAFAELDSRFDKATLTKLQRAIEDKQRALAVRQSVLVAPAIYTPTPKPFAFGPHFGPR